ncbi:hypothetical protein HB852_15445 [Listeria grandensis]|uniref:hypothetical protein n=1 Tax=Listeria grandensis TaxID=1494963 RepID=UPI001624301F|nr:hypothetical protein [Listeria grandensis]MBC1476011.1 hypothetical protein [Listeria grandensis]
MNVKESSFVLLNVLSLKQVVEIKKWTEPAIALRNHVVTEGIYPVGPVAFEKQELENEPDHAEYTFYLPLNVNIEINDQSPYEFTDIMALPETLCVRYSDYDGDISVAYDTLRNYAEEKKLELADSFYHVSLDVYGEIWLDIHAPIIGKGHE